MTVLNINLICTNIQIKSLFIFIYKLKNYTIIYITQYKGDLYENNKNHFFDIDGTLIDMNKNKYLKKCLKH